MSVSFIGTAGQTYFFTARYPGLTYNPAYAVPNGTTEADASRIVRRMFWRMRKVCSSQRTSY
mgnify:CR=1 FL=1